MFVKDYMSSPVVTIFPDMTIHAARRLMDRQDIHHLPVVDRKGRLIGLVTEGDLVHAAPSRATSLSVWEVEYLVEKIKASEVMAREVVTGSPHASLEQAARMMADKKLSCLPVVDEDRVVGILTETDMCRLLAELLHGDGRGVHISTETADDVGSLAALARAVVDAGGNLLSFTSLVLKAGDRREVQLCVEGLSPSQVQTVVEKLEDGCITLPVTA